MAHMLTQANGTIEMAYLGDDIPWHGLGNSLEAGASIEQWKESAGMNWKLLQSRVRFFTERNENGELDGMKDFANKVVLFRDDNRVPLGVVSDDYQIVQPSEVIEFFRDLTEAAGFTLSTAGTMREGRQFWALADIGAEAAIVDPRDKLKAKLLLSTSCDGSMATEGRYTTVRVVCNNTLSLARDKDAAKVKVSHRSTFDAKRVKQELGIESAFTAFDRTVREMTRLAETRVKETGALALTATLLHPEFATLDGDKQAKILRSKQVEGIGRLALDPGASRGSEYDGSHGTVYGWLNAVTEYVDHSGGRASTTADNRMSSAWFGNGAALKERAYAMALDYTPSLDDVIAATNAVFTPKAESSLLDSVLANTLL